MIFGYLNVEVYSVPVNMIEAFVEILDAMRYLITFFVVVFVVPVCIQRIDNLDNLDEKKRRRKKGCTAGKIRTCLASK